MILLDTHTLLWWLQSSPALSRQGAREIGRAKTLLVSPISFYEIALLSIRGRIRLDRSPMTWVRDVCEEDRVDVAALTPAIAIAAGLLGRDFSGDPADRLLYSTARELAVPFVTGDDGIADYARKAGDVRVIW